MDFFFNYTMVKLIKAIVNLKKVIAKWLNPKCKLSNSKKKTQRLKPFQLSNKLPNQKEKNDWINLHTNAKTQLGISLNKRKLNVTMQKQNTIKMRTQTISSSTLCLTSPISSPSTEKKNTNSNSRN